MPRRGIAVAVIVIVACFIVLGLTSDFLVDWAWFSTIRHLDVFWTILGSKAVLFVAVFAGVAGVLAILVAAAEVSNWEVFLRFFYQVPYGESDPLYGKDIGFYLFSLPAYVVLKNWLLLTPVLGVLVAGAVFWGHGE